MAKQRDDHDHHEPGSAPRPEDATPPQTNPDHPQAAHEPDSSVELGQDPPKPPSGGTSSVDLGAAQKPTQPASGGSIVEWASLVGEATSSEGAPPVMDAPSDVDLLARALAEAPPAPPEPPRAKPPTSPEIKSPASAVGGAEPPTLRDPGDPMSISVPAAVPEEPPELEADHALADDIEIVRDAFGAQPSGASGSVPLAVPEDHSDSGVARTMSAEREASSDAVEEETLDIGEEAVAAAGSEQSGVDLSGLVAEAAVEEPAAEVVGDSGIALGAEHLVEEEAVGQMPAEATSGPLSGRDLIAEAVESGVDLGEAVPVAEEEPASGLSAEAVIEEGSGVALGAEAIVEEGSSVELGADAIVDDADIPVAEEDLPEVEAASGVELGAEAIVEETSGVALGADAIVEEASGVSLGADAIVEEASGVALGADAIVSETASGSLPDDVITEHASGVALGADAIVEETLPGESGVPLGAEAPVEQMSPSASAVNLGGEPGLGSTAPPPASGLEALEAIEDVSAEGETLAVSDALGEAEGGVPAETAPSSGNLLKGGKQVGDTGLDLSEELDKVPDVAGAGAEGPSDEFTPIDDLGLEPVVTPPPAKKGKDKAKGKGKGKAAAQPLAETVDLGEDENIAGISDTEHQPEAEPAAAEVDSYAAVVQEETFGEAVADEETAGEALVEHEPGAAAEEEPSTVSYGEEGAQAEEEEPEEKPAKRRKKEKEKEEKPVRQRSRLVPFLVGGLLFGMGGVALWAIHPARPKPIKALGDMVAVDREQTEGQQQQQPKTNNTGTGNEGGNKKEQSKARESEGKAKTNFEQKAAELARDGKPLTHEDVEKFISEHDLKTHKDDEEASADVLLLVGRMRTAAHDWDDAKKTYQEGMERFKDDKKKREQFEAGLEQVEQLQKALDDIKKLSRNHARPAEGDALALILPALLADETPEAPSWRKLFADARKAADEGKYQEARKLLKDAIGRKPSSDPDYVGFVVSSAELLKYWAVMPEGMTPAKVGATLAEADKLKTDNATLKTERDELVKVAAEEAETHLDMLQLLDAYKGPALAYEAVRKELIDKEAAKPEELTTTQQVLEVLRAVVTMAKVNDPKGELTKLIRENQTLKTKSEELVTAHAGEIATLKKEHDTQTMTLKKQHDTETTKLKEDQRQFVQILIHEYEEVLADSYSPDEVLPLWRAVLSDPFSGALADPKRRQRWAEQAIADALPYIKDPEQRVQADANAVLGLALRLQGKYDRAKEPLNIAAIYYKDNPPVLAALKDALAECENPTKFYADRAERLLAWQGPEALDFLERAPKEVLKPALMAKRAILRVEVAQLNAAKDREINADPPVPVRLLPEALLKAEADLKDPEVAKSNDPEVFYAQGRLDEALGRHKVALERYTEAVKAEQDPKRRSIYEAARIRILLIPNVLRGQTLLPVPHPEPLVRSEALSEDEVLALLLTATLLQAGDADDRVKGLDAANEIIKQNDQSTPAAKMALAEAFRVRGEILRGTDYAAAITDFDQAYRMMVLVLEAKAGPKSADLMQRLRVAIRAITVTGVTRRADVPEADRLYYIGRRAYLVGNYREAEETLQAALKENEDARYYYYLGLAQNCQGKEKDAEASFRFGARLEASGVTTRRDIALALEPIQGPLRVRLNTLRELPIEQTFSQGAAESGARAEALNSAAEIIRRNETGTPNAIMALIEAYRLRGEFTKSPSDVNEGLRLMVVVVENQGGPDTAFLLQRIRYADPRLRIPDVFVEPDVVAAQRFYAIGRRHYFAGNYASAEVSFQAALKENADARYQYFLGLAQLGQGKEEAARRSFADGARLEADGQPRLDEIDRALEAVQGALRRRINTYRQGPR
jgi:tetratricopeptide (TPR) repeat protein